MFEALCLGRVRDPLANLPVGIRAYSVAHQIRMAVIGRISDLVILYRELHEMQAGAVIDRSGGIGTLAGIALVALAFGCVLISSRELTATKVGSD